MMAGGISQAVRLAAERSHHLMKVEFEVRNLDEFDEFLAARADAILLDNMSNVDMREAPDARQDTRCCWKPAAMLRWTGSGKWPKRACTSFLLGRLPTLPARLT